MNATLPAAGGTEWAMAPMVRPAEHKLARWGALAGGANGDGVSFAKGHLRVEFEEEAAVKVGVTGVRVGFGD